VNGQTGAVVLAAGDVGADPTGTANAAVGAHAASLTAHPEYVTAINVAMQAALTTGLVQGNNGPYLAALTNTTLRINATTGLYFENELGGVGDAVKAFAQQDVLLSTLGLATDGIYIRYVALDASGVASFSATPVDNDPTRVQLGLLFLSRSGGVTSFINGAAGPLNVMTIPTLANVSYTDRAFQHLAANLPMAPNANLTMNQSEGQVVGEAINWGDSTNVNVRTIAAGNPMSFLRVSGGFSALVAPPTAVTTFDPTQYWNGSALVTVPSASNATVQRIMVTTRGTIIVQYGETVYAAIADASAAMLTATFTSVFPAGYAVEVARLALRRDGTNLTSANDARIAIFGAGGSGVAAGGTGGSVDSVNGYTGTVVLDADDIAEGATNHYYPQADEDKLAGIEVGAQANVATNIGQGTRTATGIPLTSSTGTGTTLPVSTTTLAGLQSATDKAKLDGIAAGATQNSADAFLLNRANHTGTQLASTISDFAEATDDRVAALLVAGTNVTLTYDDTANTLTVSAAGGGGGGLTNITEAKTTAAPNTATPVVSLSVSITETNGDFAVIPKGAGALLAAVPNNTAAGGNKRGIYAVDLQRVRASSSQVASGTYSVILGGSENEAGASYAAIVGGVGNWCPGVYGFIGSGDGNTNSASYGVVVGGFRNSTGTGGYAAVLGGASNYADGLYTTISGGWYATTRGIYGAEARASGRFSAQGDAQRERFTLRRVTTDATATAVSADNTAAASTNQVVLPNNSAYTFSARVVARQNTTGDCAAWEIKGLVRRGASAAATVVVSSSQSSVGADAGAASWSVSTSADTTNGALAITVTGEAAKTIRWVADVQTVEVVG
uniref:hypothetical protein n=1 Tax=Pseudomonas sp. TaxID=306 RepID=UPI0025850BFF